MRKFSLVLCLGLFLSISIVNGFAFAGINDGLVAYYPFNGDANDESGNGNNGIIQEATLVDDKYGNPESAYLFDGIDDKIFVSNNGELSFNPGFENYTVSAWVKRNSIQTFDGIIMDRSDTYSVGQTSYTLMGDENGKFNFISWGGGYGGFRVDSPNNYIAGEWHLVTGVVEGSTALLYIDDVEVMQSNVTPFENNENNEVTIGNWHGTYGWEKPFDGTIDDVRIYNRALSEAEIQQLYSGNNQSFHTSLKGIITDRTNGSPVSNAIVEIIGQPSVTTGSNGSYHK